jgi:hypothetical protein
VLLKKKKYTFNIVLTRAKTNLKLKIIMPVKLNQGKVSLKLLKEKSDFIILGEILHHIWEIFLVSKREIFFFSPDSEKFNNLVKVYIKKALASYPEPLPQREILSEKAFRIIKNIFKSEEFKKFKEILKSNKILAIYREPEGFLEENGKLQEFRPDIVIKMSDGWIVFEFKLHGETDKAQLSNYLSLLKKIFPDDNIRIYLISFEPFKVELIYDFTSYPTQLSLFKNLN